MASAGHSQVRGIPLPLDREYTPVEGTPMLDHRATLPDLGTREPSEPAGGRRAVPGWLFWLGLLGAGGGGGSIAAGIGSLATDDIQAIERDIEAQDNRLDAHDLALETLRSEQIYQHRWVASELIKQSRALARIAEKVGADVDVDVEPYQSGGM
jgi:hypothetical protein